MSSPVLFLLGAVALSSLGAMVVWLLSRPRKERFGSSIDSFNRDLSALAPPGSRPTTPPAASPRTPGPRPDARARNGAPARRAPGPSPRPKG